VVIDESFIDFADEQVVPSVDRDVKRYTNAVVLKSLGKNLGLHGVRMGYAVTNPELAQRLGRALPFWNMNSLGQALIEQLPRHRAEYEAGRRQVVRDRIYLEDRLRSIPALKVYPAQANFVYLQMPQGIDGVALRNRLLCEHGCLIRECGNKLGSDSRHYRIAARPREEIDYLVECLAECFNTLGRQPLAEPRRRSIDMPLWAGK
jgi:histidinol-phosphate/aromatic aminotransferase/cobyric acid decarboxylase-like protein